MNRLFLLSTILCLWIEGPTGFAEDLFHKSPPRAFATRWAVKVSTTDLHLESRPSMIRLNRLNLNGPEGFTITSNAQAISLKQLQAASLEPDTDFLVAHESNGPEGDQGILMKTLSPGQITLTGLVVLMGFGLARLTTSPPPNHE